jgi:hypothetical protein
MKLYCYILMITLSIKASYAQGTPDYFFFKDNVYNMMMAVDFDEVIDNSIILDLPISLECLEANNNLIETRKAVDETFMEYGHSALIPDELVNSSYSLIQQSLLTRDIRCKREVRLFINASKLSKRNNLSLEVSLENVFLSE